MKSQLGVEQARVREQDRQIRELALAVKKQRGQLRLLRLERDETRQKLAVAETPLPISLEGVLKGAVPVLAGTIRFSPGSQKLTDVDLERLGEIARRVSARGYTAILVEGHSDPTPLGEKSPFRSNLHLSTVRALAVYHALVQISGIDAARVRLIAHGEFKPARGRGRSERRVDIRYLPAARGR